MFNLSLSELKEGKWCQKCPERLQRYKMLYEKKGSKILSKNLTQTIEIQCPKGHIHTCNIRRIMKRLKENCPKCNKLEKQRLRREYELKQERFMEEQAKIQQEMFRKAQEQAYYSYSYPYSP